MSEQKMLAWNDPRLDAAEAALCPCGHETLDHAWSGCSECGCKGSAMNALLSSPWLASVLADDATVEVVARALASLEPGESWMTNEELGGGPTGTRDDEYRWGMQEQARDAIAALSAHLAPPDPARAGDTSGEES